MQILPVYLLLCCVVWSQDSFSVVEGKINHRENGVCQQPHPDAGRQFLLRFYQQYLRAANLTDPRNSEKAIAALRQRYTTVSLQERLRTDSPDYDPFVNAQDYLSGWESHFLVRRVSGTNLRYEVTFGNRPKQKSRVRVMLVRAKDEYKIDQLEQSSFNPDESAWKANGNEARVKLLSLK